MSIQNQKTNLNLLHSYSESLPFSVDNEKLYRELKRLEEELHFPAVKDDVGSFLNFLASDINIKTVFEFGSGYGQSAFWFLLNNPHLKKIYLTEKREDLKDKFDSLSWNHADKEKMHYFMGDAFSLIEEIHAVDFFLVDGVKADYLRFLKIAENKLSHSGFIFIDNAFWRGSFLDDLLLKTKDSAKKIKELHDYIRDSKIFRRIFLPFSDGGILLRKINK